jgi:hypothetical protein
MIMRKLIILTMLIGCGAPPDEEELPLDETLKENVTSISDHSNCPSAVTQDTHKLVCPEGKLCPGMTKQDVLDLFGEPDEIWDPGHSHLNQWRYEPESGYCVHEHWYCYVNFDSNTGLTNEQKDIKIEYLDVMADW